MKEDALFVISKSGKGFISHMVQMKGLQDYALQLDSTYFISHMVQMKAEAIAKANSIKEALYPTWFRWKDAFVLENLMFWHFISHMVQMKADYINKNELSKELYIPHGSDESD